MIKENQKAFNRLYVVIDALLIILSYAAAYYVRFFVSPPKHSLWGTFQSYSLFLILIVPLYLLIYYFFHLYSPMRTRGLRVQSWVLFKSNLVGIILFTFLLYTTKQPDISRIFIAVFFFINLFSGFIFRYIIRSLLNSARRKGLNQKHVLLIGYSRAAQGYIDRIISNPWWGYQIFGILDDNASLNTSYRNVSVMGELALLPELLQKNNLDEIAITLGLHEYEKLESIVGLCEKSGVHTKFIPDYNNVIPTTAYTEDLDGLPVINIRNVPLTNTFNKFLKRSMDIAGSLFAIILFSIPMLIVSIIIKVTSKGPLIFSQIRVGLHNRNFKMFKFRSMEVQTETQEKKAWTTKNDPRVTTIGRFIRKTSIDELPQLFNVLRGEMSLVGPRPERPFFVEKFKEEIPRYMIKHQVRPGLTGWAQVNGFRGDTSIRKRIDCDLYYIENWTLGLDVKILFLTFFKGFVNKNAY